MSWQFTVGLRVKSKADRIVVGIKTEARRSASRDQKQMFLIVGHLATPLSETAFASAAARSCLEAF